MLPYGLHVKTRSHRDATGAATRAGCTLLLIAIGANLPDAHGRGALANCRAAVEALRSLPGLRVVAVSRWHRTAPQPAADQPDYINGVVRLAGAAEPAWLLARLQAIEAAAGRQRSVANAARPLDLDIIAMASLVRDHPDPVVPHPRAHLRDFVLRPLAEVAPDWVHPRLHRCVGTLIAELTAHPIMP